MTTTATGAGRAQRPLALAGERLPFAMLPRWLLYHGEVNEGAKFLYCVLHDLVQGREGPTRPVTRAALAAACGVSPDTIDRRLAQLVAVGAVEKEPRIRAGGQQANIYRVWLTPPDGLHRAAPEPGADRRRESAAPVEGGANGLVNRRRESAAPPPQPQGCGTRGRTDAAAIEEEELQEPPQPPRPAGGPEVPHHTGEAAVPSPAAGRTRRTARNPRARQTNPRAEAELAETERLEAEAAARRIGLEQATEARRAADRAAHRDAERLEAEALAVSAVLSDDQLAAVVEVVSARLAGPLARSPLALSRAVVAWCRTTLDRHPGRPDRAVSVGLSGGLAAREGDPPVDLPAAPAGTAPLRARIARLHHPDGGA